MKKIISLMCAWLAITVSAQTAKIVSEDLRYCESTYPYQKVF